MRLIPIVLAASALCGSSSVLAQEWIEYVSRVDFFSVSFPAQPKVQDIPYLSEYGATFPARVHSYESGPNRYAMTVVDYTNAERIHAERAKACPPDAHTGCSGSPSTGVGSWKVDVRGAIEFAAWNFMQRDAKLTFFGWSFVDLVEGRQLQLRNADQSRTFVGIYMHENRLYVLEATVPKGMPEPGLFQQSLVFLDKNGKGVRYQTVYSNGFPTPPRVQ